MKNKSYYMDLAERWYDALLTGDEERRLKSFLATTDDPDFDEIKAVTGFFATGKAVSAGRASVRSATPRRRFHWAAAFAVAASLILVVAIRLYHRQNDCYILANGEKLTDPQLALAEMTATLEGFFGESENVGDELLDLFSPVL